jgi:small subunit ribosomal protein S6
MEGWTHYLNNHQNLQLKGSKQMNHYETVFILTPVLSDAQVKETVEAVKAELEKRGATIINEEAWGMKKLAYPIEKKSTGFYFLLEFDGEGAVVKKLETYFRRQDRVIRFITVKNDKYAAEYAAKRRSLKAPKTEEA